MVKNKNTFDPDYATHPGEHIEEIILSRGLKKRDIAERLGITPKTLSQILNGNALISVELAMALERVLGISASFWNNLNSNYVLFKARNDENVSLDEQKEWIKRFPLKELQQRNIIKDENNLRETVNEVLNFFGVKSAKVWEEIYNNKALCFRKSNTFRSDDKSVFVWLRLGEIESEKISLDNYSEELFRSNLIKIRDLTSDHINKASKTMVKLCADAGVALVLIPELKGIRISGITEWLSPTKVLLQMSLKYKTNDHFWFTFFHEAAHIILHRKKDIFIDSETGHKSDEEIEADNYAKNILIKQKKYSKFISKKDIKINDVIEFSDDQNIHPGIVVGMLQHDKKIPYSWFNDLKIGLDFAGS